MLGDTLMLDEHHLLIDAEIAHSIDKKRPFAYASFQEAAAHLKDGTAQQPMVVYIAPGVYWIDNPDDPEIVVGKDGREPFGMAVHCQHLHLVGLSSDARDVVLASQRGQTQGAVGNFTMFDFHGNGLHVSNLTMGNYCNVDLVYPKNPRFNRKKRSDAITQAHIGYVDGDTLLARNVRFISRLNLNPLNGARYSRYENCHFECTDDALTGNGIYVHCDFDLYGQKPFYTTHGRGAAFIDCDFYVRSNNREMVFCKRGGALTLLDCRYHAPADIDVGWTNYPQKWLRCYQKNFTLNGKPYVIGMKQSQEGMKQPQEGMKQPQEGMKQPQNTIVLDSLPVDATLPLQVKISQHVATLRTGEGTLTLQAEADGDTILWKVENGYGDYVELQQQSGGTAVVIPTNNTDETVDFCIVAATRKGLEAACHVTVLPRKLPSPTFVRPPQIRLRDGKAVLDYELNVAAQRDQSDITWLRDGVAVAVSHGAPQREYELTDADVGLPLTAVVLPRQQNSDAGAAVRVSMNGAVKAKNVRFHREISTDFHAFPCEWQPEIRAGFWTIDGYKPMDTAEFEWSFDRGRPMWEYGKGFNGAVGMGLLQAQRGARLMYTPVGRHVGDMHLKLLVDPTKTAGQGFGSATGQYLDVCIKFDTQTLTGYGLRIVRTTKHAKAVDFLLVRYANGEVTPLTAPVSSVCYRTGCSIFLDFIDGKLSAHVETATPLPDDSVLAKTVDLSAEVGRSDFGGVHVQHTGSCGESTTMLHRLDVKWD